MSDQVINLVLRYRDQGSANAKRAMDAISKGMSDTGRAAQGAAQQAMRVHDQLRKVTGLRPSTALPRWFREIGTAADQTAARVQRLTQGVGKFVTVWGQAAAGAAAAAAVFSGPVGRSLNFERQLAYTSNKMFSGKSLEERKAGMKRLSGIVNDSRRAAGGTRDQAMAAVDALASVGGYSEAEVAQVTPQVLKAAVATGNDPLNLVGLVDKAKKNMGLSNAGRVLDIATKADDLGAFGANDMARWLPQQMAFTDRAGLVGEQGFAELVAANQIVARTAGSNDQAGNNLKGLLQKLGSKELSDAFLKMPGNIDLAGSIAAARAKGTSGLEAALNIFERQVFDKNPELRRLREQSRGLTGAALDENLQAQIGIFQGSAIGGVIADQEASSALVALLKGRADLAPLREQALASQGTVDMSHATVASTDSFRVEQSAEDHLAAMQTALEKVNPLLGGMAEKASEIMREFPNFSAAVVASTTALTGLAAAAAGFAFMGAIGKAGGVGAAAGAAGSAGAAALAATSRYYAYAKHLPMAAWGATAGTMATAGAGVAGAGLAGWEFGSWLNDTFINGTDLGDSIGRAVATALSPFSEEARKAIEVNIRVENGNLVAEVNDANARQARRE